MRHTHDHEIDAQKMANMMRDYANLLKSRLPEDQRQIIDIIVTAKELAGTIESKTRLSRPEIARLRGTALICRPQSMMLSTFMEMLADHFDQKPPTMN